MRSKGRATLAAVAFFFLFAGTEDTYRHLELDKIPADGCSYMPTHAAVEGFVASTRKQEDGDIHVKLCTEPRGAGACLVLELIPQIPMARPKARMRIEASGIMRWDSHGGHRWWEMHPVTSWREISSE